MCVCARARARACVCVCVCVRAYVCVGMQNKQLKVDFTSRVINIAINNKQYTFVLKDVLIFQNFIV